MAEVLIVKYLFVIFYLCVVMFLNLGSHLPKGETCGDGRRGNARYMNANRTEVDHQLIPPMTLRLVFLFMGRWLSHIYAIIYDRVFLRFPRPVEENAGQVGLGSSRPWVKSACVNSARSSRHGPI